MKKTFKERVLNVVSQIPREEVATYKEVALRAESLKAYRVATGNILKGNKDKNIPCHRVIRSDGLVGGYNKGKES